MFFCRHGFVDLLTLGWLRSLWFVDIWFLLDLFQMLLAFAFSSALCLVLDRDMWVVQFTVEYMLHFWVHLVYDSLVCSSCWFICLLPDRLCRVSLTWWHLVWCSFTLVTSLQFTKLYWCINLFILDVLIALWLHWKLCCALLYCHVFALSSLHLHLPAHWSLVHWFGSYLIMTWNLVWTVALWF